MSETRSVLHDVLCILIFCKLFWDFMYTKNGVLRTMLRYALAAAEGSEEETSASVISDSAGARVASSVLLGLLDKEFALSINQYFCNRPPT